MRGAKPPAFDWDEANVSHIARHGVSPVEAEQVIRGCSLQVSSEEREGEDRQLQLGETSSGRLLLVVWTWRRKRIRVVTAFPPNRKWRDWWVDNWRSLLG